MTLMVRDEADIIAAMIEHHLSQGVDLIIATDNGSVDGTREILADYAASGRVEVHDYLAHDKNQTGVVSEMASRAASEHAATWVINADADEFFIA
ncbi:MAG TPA: glycosyltransferase, partial [Microbacterium sp.]|nr:glycosyltransferase [Microbacterium sp.]